MLWRIILACFLASPAFASCPSTTDLAAGGINVAFDDGGVGTYQSVDADTVLLTKSYFGKPTLTELLAHGVFLLEETEFDRGKPTYSFHTDYPMPLRAFPLPTQLGKWDVTVEIQDGGESYAERHVYAWHEESNLSVGDCTFPAIVGTFEIIEVGSNDLGYNAEITYFPTLGISAVTSGRVDQNLPANEFKIVDIVAVR